MLEVSETEATALGEQSKMAKADGLTRILEVLADAEMRLRDAASKKILIEVALLKAIEARNALSIGAVLKQLQDLRDGKPGDGPPAPAAARPTAPASPAATKTSGTRQGSSTHAAVAAAQVPTVEPVAEQNPVTAGGPGEAQSDLADLWARILEAVGRASPFTRTYLLEAHPVSFAKNLLVIGFDPEFEDHIGLVDNARNHALLQTKLLELGHPHVQFKFVKAEAPAGFKAAAAEPEPAPAAPAPAKPPPVVATARSAPPSAPAKEKLASVPFSKDDFKNDPLIQKALEIFKAQIVEVRA